MSSSGANLTSRVHLNKRAPPSVPASLREPFFQRVAARVEIKTVVTRATVCSISFSLSVARASARANKEAEKREAEKKLRARLYSVLTRDLLLERITAAMLLGRCIRNAVFLQYELC